MSYEHIIFDIDGTLIYTDYAILKSLQKTIKDIQHKTVDLSSLAFALGIPGDIALKKLGFHEDSLKFVDLIWDKHYQRLKSTIKMFNGIEEMLQQLSQNGYSLGVVTSRSKSECIEDNIFNEISSYFKIQVFLDDCAEPKPSPTPLLTYLEKANIERNVALYVGDSIYDATCAENACIDFVLATWGTQNPNSIIHTVKNTMCICKKATDILLFLEKRK